MPLASKNVLVKFHSQTCWNLTIDATIAVILDMGNFNVLRAGIERSFEPGSKKHVITVSDVNDHIVSFKRNPEKKTFIIEYISNGNTHLLEMTENDVKVLMDAK